MSTVVRIFFPASGLDERNYRTVKLQLAWSVAEAVTHFVARTPITSVAEYGLFDKQRGTWLRPDAALIDYAPLPESLEFRKRTRPLRVELLDQTHKLLLVDNTWPVRDIVVRAAKKFGLDPARAAEFGFLAGSELDAHFNMDKSLIEQDQSEVESVVLVRRMQSAPLSVEALNPSELHFEFLHTCQAVLSGQLPISSAEIAVSLAALQLHVAMNGEKPKMTDVVLPELMPPQYRRLPVQEDVLKHSTYHANLSPEQAKQRYVQTCQEQPLFGCTLFPVKEQASVNDKFTVSVMLGIMKGRVVRVDPDTKDVLSAISFRHIIRWAPTDHTFTLDVQQADRTSQFYIVRTPNGHQIAGLLSDYIKRMLDHREEMRDTTDAVHETNKLSALKRVPKADAPAPAATAAPAAQPTAAPAAAAASEPAPVVAAAPVAASEPVAVAVAATAAATAAAEPAPAAPDAAQAAPADSGADVDDDDALERMWQQEQDERRRMQEMTLPSVPAAVDIDVDDSAIAPSEPRPVEVVWSASSASNAAASSGAAAATAPSDAATVDAAARIQRLEEETRVLVAARAAERSTSVLGQSAPSTLDDELPDLAASASARPVLRRFVFAQNRDQTNYSTQYTEEARASVKVGTVKNLISRFQQS